MEYSVTSSPFLASTPSPGPALTCHRASRSTGAGSWLTAAAGSSARPCAWSSEGAPSHCTGPRSWPLWERSEPLKHQGQGARPQAHPSLPASGCQSSACSPTAQVSTKGPGAILPLPPDAHSQTALTAQMVRHQEGGYPRERELERAKAGILGFWSCSIS